MFNPSFNNSFQGLGNNPYAPNNPNQGLGDYLGEFNYTPPQISGDASLSNYIDPQSNKTEGQLYPLEGTSYQNNYAPSIANYAKGGYVKQKRKMPGISEIMTDAQKLKSMGQRGDTILAHINPEEAALLAQNFGGDINPQTGLPQFGLFNKPGKWLKGSLGGGIGAVLGNMLLPGIGGIIGGSIGGAAGSAIRGRKDYLSAGLRGAGMGAALPTVAGWGGSLANALGQQGLGSALTSYSSANAILPALGLVEGGSNAGLASMLGLTGGSGAAPVAGAVPGVGSVAAPVAQQSFMGKLLDPTTLVTGVSALSNHALQSKRPKQLSGAELGMQEKEYNKAKALSPEERVRQAKEDRYVQRNRFLPNDMYGEIAMSKARMSTPEERDATGRSILYDLNGAPFHFKKGGKVSISRYLGGEGKGQDDDVNAHLSDGEFVIDATTVSNIGDGNNSAGAKELYKMVRNIRKHKSGSTKLPPKAKSLSSYMR